LHASSRTGNQAHVGRTDLVASQLEVLTEWVTSSHQLRILKVGLPDLRII